MSSIHHPLLSHCLQLRSDEGKEGKIRKYQTVQLTLTRSCTGLWLPWHANRWDADFDWKVDCRRQKFLCLVRMESWLQLVVNGSIQTVLEGSMLLYMYGY